MPTIAERDEIVAGLVMSTKVKCLRPKNVSHGNFPIVDTASSDTLYATTSRSILCTLLQRRAFVQPHDVNDGHYHSNSDGSVDYAELLFGEGGQTRRVGSPASTQAGGGTWLRGGQGRQGWHWR